FVASSESIRMSRMQSRNEYVRSPQPSLRGLRSEQDVVRDEGRRRGRDAHEPPRFWQHELAGLPLPCLRSVASDQSRKAMNATAWDWACPGRVLPEQAQEDSHSDRHS